MPEKVAEIGKVVAEDKAPSAELGKATVNDVWCPNNSTGHGVAYRARFVGAGKAPRSGGAGVCLNGVCAMDAGSPTPGGFADMVGVELSLVLSDLDPGASKEAAAGLARIRKLCEDFDAQVWEEIATLMKARTKG